MHRYALTLLFVGVGVASAFAPPRLTPSKVASPTGAASTSSSTQLYWDLSAAGGESMELSRNAFFIWFFGASGAAGIARSAFPRMYDATRTIQSLKGVGPTLGGENLGISPLCGYPEDLAIADVEKILNNKLTVEQMVKKFPVEGNFLAAKGYLTYEAFCNANKNCNPLALRAVFDTFAQSTDLCAENVAQDKIDAYRQDLSKMKAALLKSKVTGYAAIIFLLSLLGLADIVAAGHAYDGWFPDWPGGHDFPACFLDKETGPWTIPNYWVGDLPTE